MTRVVSLLPSATEIVAALGCADWLVGRSHECDFPPSVQPLPVCTAPRLDLSGSSAEIDAKVKAAVADAASVYEVLHRPLADCAPDVILTQDQCEVCAVSLADVEAALCGWTGRPVRIVSLKPMTLADVFADVERVADALGLADHGRAVADGLRDRARALTVTPVGPRPRVACIEWTDPLMAAGNWVPELVAMAGGEDVFGTAGEHAPWITWDDLKSADPDIIVFMPCGFGLERSAAEARLLMDRHPEFKTLNAARAGRVYATDANSYFNRPGPRLVESLATLTAVIAECSLPASAVKLPICA
jgi:iron complex transport system substrate-binding protein